MSSANLSLNISATLATGTKSDTPPGMNFAATPGKFDKVTVPAGTVTVTPPALTNAILVIVPPTSATVGIKNSAGDSVIPLLLSPTDVRWFVLPVATALIVTSSAQIVDVEVMYL
jgi:hypothetical protein